MEWDNHFLCHSCRDCSLDNPCDVCSDWSTLTWSKSIKAISKLSRRTNLDKTEEKVQTEGTSTESSRPLQTGNEAPVVTDQTVSDVEVPSSLALTAGSNLGLLFQSVPQPETVLETLPSLRVEGNLKVIWVTSDLETSGRST